MDTQLRLHSSYTHNATASQFARYVDFHSGWPVNTEQLNIECIYYYYSFSLVCGHADELNKLLSAAFSRCSVFYAIDTRPFCLYATT